jgi:hypothetical protein
MDLPSSQYGKKTRNIMDRPSNSPFKRILEQPMMYKGNIRRGASLAVDMSQSATAQVSNIITKIFLKCIKLHSRIKLLQK